MLINKQIDPRNFSTIILCFYKLVQTKPSQNILFFKQRNPTVESIEDIAFRKKQKSEEENDIAHENNRKAEEEERLRREELAKKMASGEELTDEVLKDIFEKNYTANADSDNNDSDKKCNIFL